VMGLVLLLWTQAFAAPPTPEDKQKAKARYEAAEKLLKAGLYDDAIREYQAAYDLAALPGFLFNLAQAHRLKGDARAATDYYQRYLTADPKGKAADQARGWINQLAPEVRAIEAREAAEKKRLADEEAARLQREKDEADRLAREKAAKQPKASPEPSPSPEPEEPETPVDTSQPSRGRGLRIAGLVTAGVGVLCIGGGVLFGLQAKSASDELSEDGATFSQSKLDDGEAAERNMFILYGVGGAAVIGGTVMYFMGRSRGRESKLTMAPVVGPRRAGVALSGSF